MAFLDWLFGSGSGASTEMDASALADMYPDGDPLFSGYGDLGGLVDPYAYPNIATDIGPSVADLTPPDWKKYLGAAGAVGKALGANKQQVLAEGRMLGADRVSSTRPKDFGVKQSPYAAPSYLAGSIDYNKMVNNLVAGLLKQQIRRTNLKTLV